jgi:predicted PurR-regulated permease PerM
LQDRGRATLDDAGKALRLWLAAQLVPMVLVSVMIATGAFLIDIPSPLA